MKTLRTLAAAALAISVAAVAGCHSDDAHDHSMSHGDMKGMKMEGTKGEATIRPAANQMSDASHSKIAGTVKVTQIAGKVEYHIMLSGLEPGSVHGFHVHEKGDLSDPGLMSTGGHWDPMMTKTHGGPMDAMSHGGDLGNVVADNEGKVDVTVVRTGYAVSDVLGKAVILHAGKDDLKTNPSGNSGGRIAGGIIRKE